jgi:hypothetical protein
MVKATKFFRKQAKIASRAAVRTPDPERSAGLQAIATAFRAQADMIKKSKREKKRQRADTTEEK